jgi:tripartite-type tricarboxylate transporter receptor subunit TctC
MKRLFAGIACGCAFAASAFAQDNWPSRPVKFIVPFPAGGSADALPRILGEKLSQRWGQSVIVENRPGAGGGIGTAAVARMEPDGYTLLTTPAGPIVTNGIIQTLTYDPIAFEPVIILATAPIVLTVKLSPQYDTAKNFIAFAKANSGKLNYATQGPGSNSHLSALAFAHSIGTQMTAVPYGGSAPALNDMMSGTIDLFFDNLGSSLPLHTGGKLKILAVATKERIKELPDVPTLIESGVGNYLSFTWFGAFAPPKTPRAIVEKANRDFAAVMALPDVRDKFAALGVAPGSGTPADVAALVKSEQAKWEGVARQAGVEKK